MGGLYGRHLSDMIVCLTIKHLFNRVICCQTKCQTMSATLLYNVSCCERANWNESVRALLGI